MSDLEEEHLSNYIASKIIIIKYKIKCLKLVRKLFMLSEDNLSR